MVATMVPWLVVGLLAVAFLLLFAVARRRADKAKSDLDAVTAEREAAIAEKTRSDAEAAELTRRYAAISDMDAAVAKARAELETAQGHIASAERGWDGKRSELEQQYAAALKQFESLNAEIRVLQEDLEDVSYGLYKPHFDFATSEAFKAEIEAVREEQKRMIRDGTATACPAQWTVGNSKAEGARMMKQYQKVMLRAFNAECDAAVAIVTWNNITKLEERLRKSYEAINQMGSVMQMSITLRYLSLKQKELRLTHEHEQKRYDEKEEQRRIREQIRDEEKAQREIERAKAEVEREQTRFEKALEQARAEAAKATGTALETLNAKVEDLQRQLEEAKQQERSLSQAQLTKAGTVYVISNIGSFGERMFKIGMTRRLDPFERVSELSDASVPFPFDVHAMMQSDNAPALEAAFHTHFESLRTNLVNPRKEFFDVDLEHIEAVAREAGAKVEFTKMAEAREYRETMARRAAEKTTPTPPAPGAFPTSLFGSASASAGNSTDSAAVTK